MTWIYVAVGLAGAGLVPLAVLAARVLAAMRGLTREIERATTLLSPAQSQPHAASGALVRTGG